jgi:glycosyltransferase involved in cell wall biosynthesis
MGGESEVSWARNQSLTFASKKRDEYDVVMLIDDDIVDYTPEDVREICEKAHASRSPVTGVYLDRNGKPTLKRYHDPSGVPATGRWVGGLGFCAIPMECIVILDSVSKLVHNARGEEVIAFTWTGIDEDSKAWLSEDIRLTKRLGGMLLHPVGVGHLKPIPLRPTAEQLAELSLGNPVD